MRSIMNQERPSGLATISIEKAQASKLNENDLINKEFVAKKKIRKNEILNEIVQFRILFKFEKSC